MARSALAVLIVLSLSGAAGLLATPPATHRCGCGTHRSARPCTCAHCRQARPAAGAALRSCGGGEDGARPERRAEPAVLGEVRLEVDRAPLAVAPQRVVRPRRDPPSPEPPRPRRA